MEKIPQMAKDLEDFSLLRKVEGVDLFAKEAHFHLSCRQKFWGRHHTWKGYHKSNDEVSVVHQKQTEQVYNLAFQALKGVVHQTIILGKEVITLGMLRCWYTNELERLGKPNPNYRAENLKERLQKDPDFSEALSFCKVENRGKNCLPFWLVYSTEINVDDAIASSYRLARKDQLEEVALYLRSVIK